MIHCFFEQSGTFKKEFMNLGYDAIDYDIMNNFNETDIIVDLFKEINNEYKYPGTSKIFNNITSQDIIIAFYPCIRFEDQIQLHFRGAASQQKNWDLFTKLEYDIQLNSELHELYTILCKFVIICLRKNLKLIIENPYSKTHYLTKYWCIKPKIIDYDRRLAGDYHKKPTQYWFINIEPKNNIVFDNMIFRKRDKDINHLHGIDRSLISSEYANRFIKTYIGEYYE